MQYICYTQEFLEHNKTSQYNILPTSCLTRVAQNSNQYVFIEHLLCTSLPTGHEVDIYQTDLLPCWSSAQLLRERIYRK